VVIAQQGLNEGEQNKRKIKVHEVNLICSTFGNAGGLSASSSPTKRTPLEVLSGSGLEDRAATSGWDRYILIATSFSHLPRLHPCLLNILPVFIKLSSIPDPQPEEGTYVS
jgi:hypothetical protein